VKRVKGRFAIIRHRKYFTLLALFLLLAGQFTVFKFGFVPTVNATPSVVATTLDTTSIGNSWQRKSFGANTRFWVLWQYSSGGGNTRLNSSIDGSDWSSYNSITSSGYLGEDEGVWWDGTYFSYVVTGGTDQGIFWREGTPQTNGTISWRAIEQQPIPGIEGVINNRPQVIKDSNGNAWIIYEKSTAASTTVWVSKNNKTDGTWVNAAGYPQSLNSTTDMFNPQLVPLTNGKLYAIYCDTFLKVYGKLYDGSWGSQELIADIQGAKYSVIAIGDNVHIVYSTSSGTILHKIRTYGSGWGSPVTVQATTGGPPSLSLDKVTNDLYCFWAYNNHIYYKKYAYNSGTWDTDPTDWIDSSSYPLTGTGRYNSFYSSYNGYIGFVYLTGSSSPYTVRFDKITTVAEAPEYDYVDSQSDVDSVADKGTHSNFESQKAADSSYDTLTEANTNTTKVNDSINYVDGQSNVDGQADKGTHSNFDNMKAGPDSTYDTLTEADTGSYATITYVGAGTKASGTGAVTPALPTGWQANDIFLLFCETANEAVTAPTGWTEVANSPQGTGTAGGTSSTRLTVFWRRATSSETAPTIADPGDHICAGILAFRNVVETGNPWDVTAGDVLTTASTSVTIPGATTSVPGCMVVVAVATGPDTTTAQCSGWTNTNLQNLQELVDYYTNSGNGGGFGVASGTMTNAGNYGSTTATVATSFVQGRISIALKPKWISNYQLDLEFQWTTADYNETNEYLCIYTGTFTGGEALKVDVWTGSSWANIISSLSANQWNNVSISSYLTNATITFRFLGGTETNDPTQSTWQIDVAIIHVWSTGVNYELELEEQFTNVNYTRSNEELCIRMGSFSADGEALSVQWWNATSSSWVTIIASLSANQWNNVSVSNYLTSSTFTIRFKGTVETNDATQSSWQKDCALLHTWTITAGYNLNLKIMDWDLTDAISNAKVTMNNGTDNIKYSNANGWANYTGVSGSVTVTVHYFGFLVNGTSFSVSADTTKNLRCKLYDVYVQILPANQQGILYTANVTVFNSSSTEPNKIRTALSNQTGYVYLPNLPNNTLTFTVYAKSDYSLVIANVTRTPTNDQQILTAIICSQNYANVAMPWEFIIIPVSAISQRKSLKTRQKKNKL
jgi:hypothetical protein